MFRGLPDEQISVCGYLQDHTRPIGQRDVVEESQLRPSLPFGTQKAFFDFKRNNDVGQRSRLCTIDVLLHSVSISRSSS